MKKVLIFAHDFPPLTSIGAMRPESWYNHFSDYGLFPIIITQIGEKTQTLLRLLQKFRR